MTIITAINNLLNIKKYSPLSIQFIFVNRYIKRFYFDNLSKKK
jgi:hypothetical protein